MILIDAILLIAILLISYSIRLDYWYFPKDDTLRLILAAPIIGIPIFVKLGIYKSVTRYIDLKALWFFSTGSIFICNIMGFSWIFYTG